MFHGDIDCFHAVGRRMGNEPQYGQTPGNGVEQLFFIIDQEDAFCLFGHVLVSPVRIEIFCFIFCILIIFCLQIKLFQLMRFI
jgi:hypothetical protein